MAEKVPSQAPTLDTPATSYRPPGPVALGRRGGHRAGASRCRTFRMVDPGRPTRRPVTLACLCADSTSPGGPSLEGPFLAPPGWRSSRNRDSTRGDRLAGLGSRAASGRLASASFFGCQHFRPSDVGGDRPDGCGIGHSNCWESVPGYGGSQALRGGPDDPGRRHLPGAELRSHYG